MDAPVDLVLPIKELHRAKSRLAGATDPAGPAAGRRRADLALALARDTLAAVLGTAVRTVAVVSADPRARALAGTSDRVIVVDDGGDGLDAAVRRGGADLRARAAAGGPARREGAVAALQADLPALRPAELTAALAAATAAFAAGAPAAFVADHTGAGTTLLVTRPGADPRPRFGPGSAAAHAALGAVALPGAWPGLRTDVDTPDDLARARALGVGPATAAWPDGPGAALPPGPGPGGGPGDPAHTRPADPRPRPAASGTIPR